MSYGVVQSRGFVVVICAGLGQLAVEGTFIIERSSPCNMCHQKSRQNRRIEELMVSWGNILAACNT
ncbi:hypothetical protein FRX31_017304 [Thalictrum thalictroides]|uniref:Uncharacterized protein n=1 Tax=Thalictrum thalictroides TaxID=46969 RepID=A0A7J6W8F2_THATH|nr:hypothetical protein FRX31_017304 [Thalictrum thalictroides]